MFWYKAPKNTLAWAALAASVCLISCQAGPKQRGLPVKYFDLKAYFKDESAKLTRQNKAITKTVNYNNQPETKMLVIKNWQRELALFSESDINKQAWRNSYKKVSNNDSMVYTAIDTNLRTRYIAIKLKANQVNSIHIVNVTTNQLYKTRESLAYYPDSLYQIEKHQLVKVLGKNNYLIIGKFK